MRIAITGAAGGIGRSLMRVLGVDHDVTGIVRTVPSDPGRWVRFDDKAELARALSAEVVIHGALNTKVKASAFIAVNTALTREVLEAAIAGGCRSFVYVSSQVVYSTIAPPDERGYREDQRLEITPYADAYTRLKIEGEAMVREACGKAGVDFLIVRPTVVMGPGLNWSEGIVEQLRRYVVGLHGRTMNLIAVDDLSRMLKALLEKRVGNDVFNLGAVNATTEAYFDAIGRLVGKPVHYLPRWLLDLVGRALPSTMWFFARNVAIDCEKIVAATDVRPATPIDAMFTPLPRELEPATLDALKSIVRAGTRFTTYGQGYGAWFNPRPDGDIVSMAAYSGIVAIDGDRVRVKAGTPLSDIIAALEAKGRQLATLPEFARISAGACFFLDVHGSDARHFSMYELIDEIRYLDPDGNEAVSTDKTEWPALRRRRRSFILTEVTFSTEPLTWLSNRMSWEDDAKLEPLLEGGYRDNLATTIQWYPGHRKLLVYNINRFTGSNAGTAASIAPFRGLPYWPQRLLIAALMRGRTLQVDRSSAILAPWATIPFERLVRRVMRHRKASARDMVARDVEICVRLDEGVRLIAAVRQALKRRQMRLSRGQGIGIRFGHKAGEERAYVWIEMVSNNAAASNLFLELAREHCPSGVTFHGGKYRPA